MRVSDFDFDLPENLVADRPVEPREAARLLDVPDFGAFRDLKIGDLPALLRAGDLLVFNDTRVIPARLFGLRQRPDGVSRIEILLHRRLEDGSWRALARPLKRLKPGDVIEFDQGFSAEVRERRDDEAIIAFRGTQAGEMAEIERLGSMPLPPYILARRPADERDRSDYQTIFAREEGAVAAPTAGLHFTPALLDAIRARGVETAAVTLHVGAGTFLPVKVEDLSEHRMHAERGEISASTVAAIAAARARGGRVIAVGTTSLRLLETVARIHNGGLAPWTGDTDIFIAPGFRFQVVDLLLTNFHLPRSTLVMLVAAFIGMERWRSMYSHAVAQGYRFYSYGDAALLERAAV